MTVVVFALCFLPDRRRRRELTRDVSRKGEKQNLIDIRREANDLFKSMGKDKLSRGHLQTV